MRIAHIARTLGAGAALYVAMAACSASDQVGSSPDAGLDAFLDAVADSVTAPVKDAKAETLPPDVVTEPCDKVGMIGNTQYQFASHSYIGATIVDLSALRAVGHYSPKGNLKATVGPGVFEHTQAPVLLRANEAVVWCGPLGSETFDSVQFIRPR